MPLPFDIASTPDFSGFVLHHITCMEQPDFTPAYDRLWQEFGDRCEMETRDVLRARFRLAPQAFYEMVEVVAADGDWAAVCDYTVLAPTGPLTECLVHLSHTLVNPVFRQAHLASKLLHFTIRRAQTLFPGVPLTLLAEVEYDDGQTPDKAIRLRAFEKIGLQKVDPRRVRYFQPDFTAPQAIDDPQPAHPLPLQLLLIRIGREQEHCIRGEELRRVVSRLYWLYGRQFRPQDMAHPDLDLTGYPAADEPVALVPPTFPAR